MEGAENAGGSYRLRYVIVILLGLITFNIVAILLYSFLRVPTTVEHSVRLCQNDACNITAQRFLDNMEPKVDPCDNFYHFACGGYVSRAVIPEGKEKTLISVELKSKTQNQLKNLLDNLNSKMNFLPKPYRYLGHLYSLCMGQDDAIGVQEARILFHDLGVWSLIDNSSLLGNWTFQDTEVKLRNLSFDGNSLLKIHVNYNTSNLLFMVEKPDLGLPTSELVKGMKAPAVQKYYKYMVDMISLYGINRDQANVTMKDTLDFEIDLARLIESRKENLFSSNYTVDELSKFSSTNWISWKVLLKSLVPGSFTISANQTVFIDDPEYIDTLNAFLSQKNSRTVADYMMWQAAEWLAPVVSKPLRGKQTEYKGTGILPRWSHCLQILSRKMDLVLSSLYVKNYVEKGVKRAAESLVLNIRQEIIDNVDHKQGLDESEKEKLKQEITRINTKIAYPDELENVDILEDYYKDLSMNKDSFLLAFLELAKWERDSRTNRTFWIDPSLDWTQFSGVSSPSATFSVTEKSISLKVGLLQPPVFSSSLPLYVDYGSIGYLVAHNLIHTLENQENKTKESDDEIEYKDALKLAYQAYRKCTDHLAEPEAMLPGLQQYNNDQLFMISMANLLCTKYRTDKQDKYGRYPIERKINGVVKTSEDFARAFNCSST